MQPSTDAMVPHHVQLIALPSRCCVPVVLALVAIAASAVVGRETCCSGSSSSSGRSRSGCGGATACGGCPCYMCAPLKSARLLVKCLQQTHLAYHAC
jgi:hypothetical protein